MAVVVFSKIGIIGGGISGLAAAKQLAEYNPIVLEATDSIGGVWKHCSFRTTKLQTPRCYYEFSDYPWPLRDNSTFPSYTEILVSHPNRWRNHRGAALSETDCSEVSTTTIITNSVK
ncbi:putative flavin-containing monooxygenase [Helianthus anomalus]